MRKAEIACLLNGKEISFSRIVPAIPAFEGAFAAFSRNCLLSTDRGMMSVEDLWPGDKVRTASNGFQTLIWKGSTVLVPQAQGQDPAMGRLVRITTDALGIARPLPDLVLGPKARLVHRAPGIRTVTGAEAALIPAGDFVDGQGVLDLALPAPVTVYHLAFAGHERIALNGVEVESYHPGPLQQLGIRSEMLDLYLSCFPQLNDIAGFGGTCLPRLRLKDLDLFDVA